MQESSLSSISGYISNHKATNWQFVCYNLIPLSIWIGYEFENSAASALVANFNIPYFAFSYKLCIHLPCLYLCCCIIFVYICTLLRYTEILLPCAAIFYIRSLDASWPITKYLGMFRTQEEILFKIVQSSYYLVPVKIVLLIWIFNFPASKLNAIFR